MMRQSFLALLVFGLCFPGRPVMAATQTVDHHGLDVDAAAPEECYACHDGTTAIDISPCAVGSMKGQSSHHPVDISFPPDDKAHLFHAPAYIEAQSIPLVDGKATCISCHDLNQPAKFHLRLGNTGSRLCLTCHKI